ncbi:hypothetical protein D3C85_1692130 [compost metagenome]
MDTRAVHIIFSAAGQFTGSKTLMMGRRKAFHFGYHVDDVHPQPVYPFIQPKSHHLIQRLTQLGVLPVEIRLLP